MRFFCDFTQSQWLVSEVVLVSNSRRVTDVDFNTVTHLDCSNRLFLLTVAVLTSCTHRMCQSSGSPSILSHMEQCCPSGSGSCCAFQYMLDISNTCIFDPAAGYQKSHFVVYCRQIHIGNIQYYSGCLQQSLFSDITQLQPPAPKSFFTHTHGSQKNPKLHYELFLHGNSSFLEVAAFKGWCHFSLCNAQMRKCLCGRRKLPLSRTAGLVFYRSYLIDSAPEFHAVLQVHSPHVNTPPVHVPKGAGSAIATTLCSV